MGSMEEEITSYGSDGSSLDSDCDMSRSNSDMDINEHDSENCDEEEKPPKLKENPAWADAMAKILKTNKPKRRKTIVLSRAKRENEIKTEVKEENLDFEIEGDKRTEIKKEICIPEEKDKIKRLKKKEWASRGRVKPSVLEKDREKALAKIATRGVVQLFNAVREHQKSVEKDLEDAGPMEHKKERVLKSLDKRAFLDVLMGPAKSQPVSNLIPKEIKEDPDNPTWSILRDDFMMSSKLKDWDKKEAAEVKD